MNRRTFSNMVTAALSGLGRDRHFIIATVILLGAAAAIAMLGWVVKYPVPWPENVVVDEDFRMLSLPDRFGPYVKASKDGEIIFERSIMRSLGLGTSYDKARYPKRRSNWYVAQRYQDVRATDPAGPYSHWRLEVYYYTGLKDQVPHVPLRCLEAGGAEVLGDEKVTFTAPAAPPPWNKAVAFQRVHWEKTSPGRLAVQGVEYYVFSFNGKQERRWEIVRLKTGLPLPRYNYFAKIQFSPAGRGTIHGVQEADQAAAEFIKHALPCIVQTLPTAADIDRLAKAEEQNGE